MTPKPAEASGVSEIYELLRYAAAHRQHVSATYDGQARLLCPHVGGRKSSCLHVFCYQFGGSSNSVEPLAPGGRGGLALPGCGETQSGRVARRRLAHRATLATANLH